MDPNEMRFRAQHSPRSDATTMNSLVSPPRNRLSQTFQPPAQDPRSNLSRRFTTDSGRVPTLSTNIGPRGPEHPEYQQVSGWLAGLQACGRASVCLRACLALSLNLMRGAWTIGRTLFLAVVERSRAHDC